jgi:SAM-dependent methyltransferase
MSIVQPEEGREEDRPYGAAIAHLRGESAREHRAASLQGLEDAAAGWIARQEQLRELSAPVSHWMIDAIDLQPGQRVLELAAGLGDTGFLAAELVAPAGGVITSDQADAMLDGARRRAGELGLTNVEFQVLNAEWIDLPVASVDAVLCRWGYMLMADPAVALAESRRVLRPEGHVALAVWDAIEHNPWARVPAVELMERGLIQPPPAGTPGPFALSDKRLVRELLEGAGFQDVWVERVDLIQRTVGIDEFWETTLDLSKAFRDTIRAQPKPEVEAIRESIGRRLHRFTTNDGTIELPMRTLVGVGTA